MKTGHGQRLSYFGAGLYWKFLCEPRRRFRETTRSNADPYETLQVPPDAIRYENTFLEKSLLEPGRVYGGPWDASRVEFEETKPYRSVVDRYVRGKPWEETPQFQYSLREIERGNESRGARTPAELRERYRRLDRIYESIERDGYRSQRELVDDRPERTEAMANDVDDPLLNEITVCIGRDGTFYRQGAGRHRLAIAKVLDLETVPVQVRVRHARWQSIRDDVRSAESPARDGCVPEGLLSHPDLAAIR